MKTSKDEQIVVFAAAEIVAPAKHQPGQQRDREQ
jgi:hypothetical protein